MFKKYAFYYYFAAALLISILIYACSRQNNTHNEVVTTPPTTELLAEASIITPPNNADEVVETPPSFHASNPSALEDYLKHNLVYPPEAKQKKVEGIVLVGFLIDPTGQIQQPSIKKGIGAGCDEEALRLIKNMPKWEPGMQNNQAITSEYTLPILFTLPKKI